MKFDEQAVLIGAREGEAQQVSAVPLESQLVALEDRYHELPGNAPAIERARLELAIARVRLGLAQHRQVWDSARKVFDVFIQEQAWQEAAEACDLMFQSGQEQSLSALGQGVWLAVTFPVEPELTLALLQHIVDETPDDADGAAVAAAVAIYVIELRQEEGRQKDSLLFFANQLLGAVARRHSQVETQQQFDFWLQKLELDQEDKILVRLRNIVDVLVQEDWWFDREALQQQLPLN